MQNEPEKNRKMTINEYIRAGYPALCVQSVEEDRLIGDLAREYPDRQLWQISGTGELRDLRKNSPIDEKAGYSGAFKKLAASGHVTILVVLDAQHPVRNAGFYRPLRNVLQVAKNAGHVIILIAPSWSLSEELSHEIPVCNWSLPTRAQLSDALQVCEKSVGMEEGASNRDELLDAGAGLTLVEAEGAFALAWDRKNRTFDRAAVEDVKMGLIRASGALSLEHPRAMSEVGGLSQVRQYLEEEVKPSINDPEVMVKGLLLVGVPGTGKSLLSRVTGSVLGWPVVRLNLAAVKGSLVGQSEAQLRQALACIDAVAPAVLWLDELEKAVGGYASSANTDSGVTLSIVGELLTWMQEHTSKVLIIATCNDHSKLPAEMTRSGRFDSLWFVDLPSLEERLQISMVHLTKYKLDETIAPHIAHNSGGWTGAEIEGCVRAIARRVRGGAQLDRAMIASMAQVVPLSRSRGDEIERLREWGKTCCLIANDPEVNKAPVVGRHLDG